LDIDLSKRGGDLAGLCLARRLRDLVPKDKVCAGRARRLSDNPCRRAFAQDELRACRIETLLQGSE